MNADADNYFCSDRHLTDPANDELGRSELAENLSKGLLRMRHPEGYVVAIFGPWGSGKSTLLAFTQHYLQEAPQAERPIVVEFNPWWFSGREDLTMSFFNQLSAAIDDGTCEVAEIRELVTEFADLVSHYPHWTAKVGGFAVKRLAGKKKSVPKLKKDLGDRLIGHGKRVIVVIDDVDRLVPTEILDVFRLVKAVGDLPNVLYLLALDKQAVANAITSTAEINGESYIEKIVQLPIELPVPDRVSLRDMFHRQFLSILSEKSAGFFDKYYWREIYLEGIAHFLKTPRDVVRFINALKIMLPIVEGEVNPVDFIAMEALRILSPLVYDEIRFHPDQFAGSTPAEGREKASAFHKAWMEKLEESHDGPSAKILKRVFPKFESAFRNVEHRDQESWRRLLRACSPDKLPIYFSLAPPLGDITRMELDDLAAASAEPTQFGAALVDLVDQRRPDGRTRVCQALEQLCDANAEIIPQNAIPTAIRGLLDVGDRLLAAADKSELWGMISNRDRITRLMLLLLHRMSEPQRFDVLKDAIEKGKALSAIVEITSALGDQYGKYSGEPSPEKERLFTEEKLSALESLAAERIAEAAEMGNMVSTPEFGQVLYRWKDWGGQDALSEWLDRYLADDTSFLSFLKKLIPDEEIGVSKDPISNLKKRQFPSLIRDFVDIEKQANRIESLSQRDDLTDKDRIRLGLLLRETKQQVS